MNLVQRVLALREAGQVQRAHTISFVGPYNIAIHSYNAVNLLLLLYPDGQPPLRLVKAVLWHDVPERWTGDIPSPAKWANPPLKHLLGIMEYRLLKAIKLYEPFQELTLQEQNWLTGVDLLELLLWGHDQLAMGNKTVEYLIHRVENLIRQKGDAIPGEVQSFINIFEWQRTPECNELNCYN